MRVGKEGDFEKGSSKHGGVCYHRATLYGLLILTHYIFTNQPSTRSRFPNILTSQVGCKHRSSPAIPALPECSYSTNVATETQTKKNFLIFYSRFVHAIGAIIRTLERPPVNIYKSIRVWGL